MFMPPGNFISLDLARRRNFFEGRPGGHRNVRAPQMQRRRRRPSAAGHERLAFARAYYDRQRATIFREVIDVDQQTSTDGLEDQTESHVGPERHPVTRENSPEETIRRMRSLPERADKLREAVRALREANSR